MKYLDDIEVLTDKYEKHGIPRGTHGTIIMPEIRNNSFLVEIFDLQLENETQVIAIDDMNVVTSSDVSDETILDALPNNDPNWWCKVENGYIVNLKGDRKNKTPYDYKS